MNSDYKNISDGSEVSSSSARIEPLKSRKAPLITTKALYLLGLFSLFVSFLILIQIYDSNVQKGGYRANDIFYIWSDGHSIAHGINPYSKIDGSDMLKNKKYATYLPGFFLIVSAYVSLGFDTFGEWLDVWKPASLLIHFAVGVLLFFAIFPKGGFFLSLFGSQFWLLSRWTVGVMNSGQIDALAILLLLISLLVLEKHKKLALLLFGASLAVKQIGVFILPVYLLYNSDLSRPLLWNIKNSAKNFFWIALLPFLLCLPFIIWDLKGLFLSLIFSATRSPGGHLKVPGVDELLGYVGLVAKIPMILMMGLVYLAFLQRKIGIFLAGLALYLSFISFNSVLFKQYMPWFCAFLGLAMAEFQSEKGKAQYVGAADLNS